MGDYSYCTRCGKETEHFDSRYCSEHHCKECHKREFFGYESCYCGNCMFCYGCAGGNECNVCG